jgi:small subunit ribosomal protein S6
MRVYEELFIVKPGTPEEEIDAYIGQIKDLIVAGKGTVDKADKWGNRKLAYRVQKYSEGFYILIQFSAPADLVKEVERRMRNTDTVIKFITVRIDERLKKIGKRKLHRDKRAARKPPVPVSVPAIAVPVGPAMPAEPAATPGAPAPGLPGGSPSHAAPSAPPSHPAPSVPAQHEPKAPE